MTDHDKVLETAEAWLAQGHAVALATVVKTWGSAPRPAGSQLAVRNDGTFVGSVSGGCVEGAVIAEALEAMGDGKPRKLSFGVSNDQAWSVGLACGGQIEIFVERVEPA
jgi:xanthine/CO dehydrogenase XdhC/CoxF family maturation factor